MHMLTAIRAEVLEASESAHVGGPRPAQTGREKGEVEGDIEDETEGGIGDAPISMVVAEIVVRGRARGPSGEVVDDGRFLLLPGTLGAVGIRK